MTRTQFYELKIDPWLLEDLVLYLNYKMSLPLTYYKGILLNAPKHYYYLDSFIALSDGWLCLH